MLRLTFVTFLNYSRDSAFVTEKIAKKTVTKTGILEICQKWPEKGKIGPKWSKNDRKYSKIGQKLTKVTNGASHHKLQTHYKLRFFEKNFVTYSE